MPIIAALLSRTRGHWDGRYVPDELDVFYRSDRPASEKAWEAWVRASVALEQNRVGETFQWLQTAEQFVPKDDDVCSAEILLTWAEYFDYIDEPRDALQCAYAAWERWYDLSSTPDAEQILTSLRPLLAVIDSDDEQVSLTDSQLYLDWMEDRLALRFHMSSKLVIHLCGLVGVDQPALDVAEAMREWYDQHLRHLPESYTGVMSAGLLGDLANLFANLGDDEASLRTFREAVEILEDSVDTQETRWRLATYRFNMANQLAKVGNHAEATELFKRAKEEFERLGEDEPALRAEHARLVSTWKMGEVRGIRPKLEQLLLEYETIYDETADFGLQRDVRQNLDEGYRLWLTLAAREVHDNERLMHRFLGQLYALRESTTGLARAWAELDATGGDTTGHIEIECLANRLARLDDATLLIIESGIDTILLVTIRSDWTKRLTDQVRVEFASPGFEEVLETLLREYQNTTNSLSQRSIGAKSHPTTAFSDACSGVWNGLPSGIRRDLAETNTVFVAPSNVGNLDEIPVELFHDGQDYLGVRKSIVRVSSLQQLLTTLSENRLNIDPYKKGLIVRAGEIEGMSRLSHADDEVTEVKKQLDPLIGSTRILPEPSPEEVEPSPEEVEPSPEEVLDALSEGLDILHYVGHGFADERGEALLLGEGATITAHDLLTVGPAPTPISVMSSCLLGRARHLRTGEQRGVAVTLLKQGTPAVLAATYKLPDFIGRTFVSVFYQHSATKPFGEAMRLTRQTLASKGYHPGAWGSFVMLGHPNATLHSGIDIAEELSWQACIARLLATRSTQYIDLARDRLRADPHLSHEQQRCVLRALDAFVEDDSTFFTWERLTQPTELEEVGSEAHFYYWALSAIGYLNYGETETPDEAADRAYTIVNKILPIQQLLDDSYLLVALISAYAETGVYPVEKEEGRYLLKRCARAFEWINADDELLVGAQETLSRWNEVIDQSITIDVPAMLGVDDSTFAAADAGDQEALEQITRNILAKQASVAALTSPLPWTDWLLRVIGCSGGEQPIADFLGVVGVAETSGRLTETEAEVLYGLMSAFFGPGEADTERVQAAIETFAERTPESEVLTLFVLFDQMVSGERDVSLAEIERAIQLSESIDSVGAEMFFTGVWCQKVAEIGAFESAFVVGRQVLETLEELAADDAAYVSRVGVTALLLQQVSEYLGDEETATLLGSVYSDQIETYLRDAIGTPSDIDV